MNEDEGEIVIKGTYTTKAGQEVPVEIHTNQHGLIYQRWREELAGRGGGARELKEGEIVTPSAYQRYEDPGHFQKQAADVEAFERRVPLPKKAKGRTLVEVFAEEQALTLAKIQLRLDELRKELRHAPANADAIRLEILDLEKKLLGDP